MRLTALFTLAGVGLATQTGFASADPAKTDDRVLILSGGDTPSSNHYSQYLQTKLLTDKLRERLGPDAVDVRFGAGNRPNQIPDVYDVHREVVDSGVTRHVVLPGRIDRNGAATKENIKTYFHSDALGNLGTDATFFLLVTDHGMPNQGDEQYQNNCINLWAFNPTTLGTRAWIDRCLSVNVLRYWIKTKLPATRTVFAMSQCYSGGFHKMSVTVDGSGYPKADPTICGFTAVTPNTTASGCTPNVDGPGYKGYERSFAQQLTGYDVVTGKPLPSHIPKASLRDAHRAAALEDTAKDIPFSTSDFYLTNWSDTIDDPKFIPRTKLLTAGTAQKLFYAALNGQTSQHPNVAQAGVLKPFIVERLDYLAGTKRLLENYDLEAADLAELPLDRLEPRLAEIKREREKLERQAERLDADAAKLRFKYLYEPWRQALLAGELEDLGVGQVFEHSFIRQAEERVAGRHLPDHEISEEGIFRMAIWGSAKPQAAATLSHFLSQRASLMNAWLRIKADDQQQEAFDRWQKLLVQHEHLHLQAHKLEERHDLLMRIVYTRRQIAAAVTLAGMQDQEAIRELQALSQCEATPFRTH